MRRKHSASTSLVFCCRVCIQLVILGIFGVVSVNILSSVNEMKINIVQQIVLSSWVLVSLWTLQIKIVVKKNNTYDSWLCYLVCRVMNLWLIYHCHIFIGDPIGSPIIVTIWKVVFVNKSRTLGWIWMKLGSWGWGLKRLSLARPQRNRAMGFGENTKNGSERRCSFCHVSDAPLLPLSLDRFPPNFPWTRVQVVARDTWFHIAEKFPLRDRISRKTVFLWYFRVPCLCPGYGSRESGNVLRRLDSFHPLVDIPHICPS